MLNLITRSNLETEYPKMVKALSRAMDKTALGDFWSIDDLVQHLINDAVGCFFQMESGYYGVFMKTHSPQSPILKFFWSGKDPDNKVEVDWEEVDAFLNHAARQLGCTIIECEGRRGWKPLLESLGYSEDSVLYTKKVQHELPSV